MESIVVWLLVTGTALGIIYSPPTNRVVLLPQPDGRPSAVYVRNGQQPDMPLNTPYGMANQRLRASPQTRDSMTPAEVYDRYGNIIRLTPPGTSNYQLYFERGSSTELTPESRGMLVNAVRDFNTRQASEIMVIGHTDAVGTFEANDVLSANRAAMVRDMLIQVGCNPNAISVVGRGKRDLLIPTPDDVSEPLNRRVQILVR